jgi:DNA recombination protein RmuC
LSNVASPDLIFIIAIITAIFALGAMIFGYLGFEAANKAQIKINYRLEVLENGLKHFLGNSFDEMRALRGELSGGFRDFRNESNIKLQGLIDKNDTNSKALLETLINNLDKLREGNEQKLEQMRATVDEKLQGTLTERLGEGFKQVSDHLEKVHKGLGEMQNLATGVGDLKRVLTNVKSRGTWGEVQLEMLLQDILTPNQFDKNVRINPASTELVEFAVRLPGKEQDNPVFLAIDAKFPQEDYERLAKAQDDGNADAVEIQSANLEKVIRKQAKDIQDKYIFPPYSTDFAIMYLPTEGLFAEIIRRPGLVQEVQSKHRVVITGPTTLAALLNSLQMGFRTLAIEKRSSEVWKILEAAKREFNNYGGVMDKLRKQLDTAQKTVTDAEVRTRAINRTLKNVDVEQIPSPQANVISITDLIDDESDAE